MARIDAMTIKMDAQYKELQSRAKKPTPDLDDDDIPMLVKKRLNLCKPSVRHVFTMIIAIETRIAIIGVQANEMITKTFMNLKTQLETVVKNHQASNQNLETKFDKFADKQSGRPSGSLLSNTQPNPQGNNSKAYQSPQSHNEHVNVVFTRSGKSYNPLENPNDQQNNSETPINFDSDDEDDETAPQPKTQPPKPAKETPLPKPYKLKIPYSQRLRKEKMEARYRKFLDMI
nr:hypothetical protein [Tanacetum cinerariifolium]